MGKSKRKQKAKKEADFKKVKFKVGKKLRKQQDTNTNFRVKKLVIQDQLGSHAEIQDDPSSASQSKHSVEELCNYLKHHKTIGRKESLQKIIRMISENPALIKPKLTLLLPSVSSLLTDEDVAIRKSVLTALQIIMTEISAELLAPHFQLLVAHLNCALSHIHSGIKYSALELFASLLQRLPLLCQRNQELFNSLMQNCTAFAPASTRFASNSSSKIISVEKKVLVLDLLMHFLEERRVSEKKMEMVRDRISTEVESWGKGGGIWVELEEDEENPFVFPVLYPSVSQSGGSEFWNNGEHLIALLKHAVPFLFGLWTEIASGEHKARLDLAFDLVEIENLSKIIRLLIEITRNISGYLSYSETGLHRDELNRSSRSVFGKKDFVSHFIRIHPCSPKPGLSKRATESLNGSISEFVGRCCDFAAESAGEKWRLAVVV